ncbi:Hypothetical protein BN2458_PEG1667 [Helicobacter typhlonius]|uniref:Uncharacterized protein n=1 Tax=Helicobacter typhlonius TaxID=76936 RepID=A0A0S4PXR9_9HELI|nr:Hypothetical protein BN2458_PEG1667 [Helicobacter typhlonius]
MSENCIQNCKIYAKTMPKSPSLYSKSSAYFNIFIKLFILESALYVT